MGLLEKDPFRDTSDCGGVQIDWQASLTRAARDFVIDFDAGRQVQPFACRLVFRRFL
ncbi:hypothetical protein [Candidatus Palauibacter sp.]|uniref:hypothetical protein n=1 Tax=Candidatus Palauibacter sp. TaxID=3101350 RepID=UPI003B59E031